MQCCVTGTSDATEFMEEMILTLEVHHKVVVNQVPMWKEGVSAANPYCVSFVYWSMFIHQEFTMACKRLSTLHLSILISSVRYFHSLGTKATLQLQLHISLGKAILKGLPSPSIYLLPSIKSTLNVTFSWWLPWVLCESAFLLIPHH